jgi:hypothetical protein
MSRETPLVRVARIFAEAGVPYAVIGAHAVNAWLEPRFTADVDLTAQIDGDRLRALAAALEQAGLAIESELGAGLSSGPDFVRFASPDRLLVIEIQGAKTALQREVIRRAVPIADGVRVATPEDLILLKLIANRPKDRADLAGLVRLPDLDWSYVDRAAREWDVAELLAELRRL